MSLIINQGVQPKEEKKEFPVIVENDVKLVVEEITLCTYKTEALNIKFRILTGTHKNQNVFDTVDYNPKSEFSWKYRSLRNCAGVPYITGESAQIDIEDLLKGRVINADLSARVGKDKDGNPKDYQNIKYKMPSKNATPASTPEPIGYINAKTITRPLEFDEDDLPFKEAVETPVAQPRKATESTDEEDDWT